MYPIPIKSEVIDELEKRYELVDIINLVFFDLDLEKLQTCLSSWSKYKFANNQRLIILHHDTDYYVQNQGNTTYNLIKLLSVYQIATEHVIIITNHYGLRQEVQYQSSIAGIDPPKVVYTSLWYDFPDTERLGTISLGKFKYLYCCLNGIERSHRVATLCYLDHHNLLANGILSYHFDQ